MAVQLALTPDRRWDADVDGLVEAASEAGFSSLGIHAGNASADAARAFGAAGLRCHEVLALVLGGDDDSTLAVAETLAAAAATMGSPWITTVFLSGGTAGSAALIERCAAMFADAGAGMAVEFSPLGGVPTIGAGLEVVAAAGAARAGLVIDTWHFAFGDSSWDDLAAVPLEQIAYVQFSDAPPLASDDLMRETLDRRVLPGEGVLELDRFAATLLDRGWDGIVSVEVLSQALLAVPVREVARRAFESSVGYWR